MSARNTLEAKRARRARKNFRKVLPAFLDLTDWLKDHGHAQTSGEASRLMVAGKVKADSHTIGRVVVAGPRGKEVTIPDPHVPADLRDRIQVIP